MLPAFQVRDCHAKWRVFQWQKIQVDVGAIDTPPASECNDIDIAAAEGRVTTATAGCVVEAASACDVSECNDIDKTAAEVRVTTPIAAGFVEAVSACADFVRSSDAHIPCGEVKVNEG